MKSPTLDKPKPRRRTFTKTSYTGETVAHLAVHLRAKRWTVYRDFVGSYWIEYHSAPGFVDPVAAPELIHFDPDF